MLYPVVGPITQGFKANPQFAHQLGYGHTGQDQAANIGSPVYAIADGTVIVADWGSRWSRAICDRFAFIYGSGNSGIGILVQHDGFVWGDMHLSRTDLNPGDKVVRGQIIGYSGNTGLSTGPHVHYEAMVPPCPVTPMFGRYNPQNQIIHEQKVADSQVLKPHQRRIGPNPATMRRSPSSGAAPVRTIPGRADHPANGVENFTGYVIGQAVNIGGVNSNIWYVDHGDDGKSAMRYVWAGMFERQVTAGLKNLTPPPPDPTPDPASGLKVNQRLVGSKTGAVLRKTPEVVKGNETGRVASYNTIENFTHYTRGQKVTVDGVTTDLWYKDSVAFAWAGSFTVQTTTGLVEWKPADVPDPVVPPVTDTPYTFEKSVAVVTEVMPAKEGFFQEGNIVIPPPGIVIHEFNAEDKAVDPVTNHETVHIGSVINAFTTGSRVASAHFAVEGNRIIQFVHHSDRAYHASAGNSHWGIETYGGQDPATVASVVRLILALEELAGKQLPLSRHRDHAATKCGAHIDIAQYNLLVAAARAGTPPEESQTSDATSALINELATVVSKYDIRSK